MNRHALAPNLSQLSRSARVAVLVASFAGLLFDGWELGLMPIASLSVTKSILGPAYTDAAGGEWFAKLTAALMLGAAMGGIWLGNLGDRIGRVRAMAISILSYSVFAGLGAFVTTLDQMLLLRFLCGLGVGGMWPNGVALVSECWPNASRPLVSGIMGAGINVGVLTLSQVARYYPISPDSWRWLFGWSAIPAVLGILVLLFLPESPKWLAMQSNLKSGTTAFQPPNDWTAGKPSFRFLDSLRFIFTPMRTMKLVAAEVRRRIFEPPVPDPADKAVRAPRGSALRELFRPPLLRLTVVGIILGCIPLVGAWSASKWMIPWADKMGGAAQPGYKALTQGWWAFGSTLGSFFGAQIAGYLGRRLTYFLISLGATTLTLAMFNFTAPLEPSFFPVVFIQGFVTTLFFGWLPLYLPELFPTRVRAAGSGLAFNSGRFLTAVLVFAAASLVGLFEGDYAKVGSVCALVYALGMIAIRWAPDTTGKDLDH